MAKFELHPTLQNDTVSVADLPLSALLLMNDSRFPWLILVPKKASVLEIHDLEIPDQNQLLQEIVGISQLLKEYVRPDKLNVASIGNRVPQLHIHIVARKKDDLAWPAPVWGYAQAIAYTESELQRVVQEVKIKLPQFLKKDSEHR